MIEFFPHYIGHLEKCKMARTPQESILYPSFMCPFISFVKILPGKFDGTSRVTAWDVPRGAVFEGFGELPKSDA